MKSKKFSKKLRLNKHTVSNLNNQDMGVVLGGDIDTAGICPSPDPLPTAIHYPTCAPTCDGPTCPTYTGGPNSNPCCKTC